MPYQMSPEMMGAGGGAFGGGAGSTGGMPSFSSAGGLEGGAGEMTGGFDPMSMLSGMGGGLPGMGGGKAKEAPPQAPKVVHKGKAPNQDMKLPTLQEIVASLGKSPSITGRIFGGF